MKESKKPLPKKTTLVAIGAAILVVGIVGVSLFLSSNQTLRVHGSFILGDFTKFGNMSLGDKCEGSGGYNDINNLAQVIVKDGIKNTIAITQLSDGAADGVGNCIFSFAFTEVPKKDFYSFEVSKRGDLSYSHNELVARDYNVSFTLGDIEEQETDSKGDVQYVTLPSRVDALKIIRVAAQDKWSEDYSMVQYEINLQTEAYDWLVSIQKDNPKILQWSLKKWSDNYTMVKYEYDQQLEAFSSL